MHPPTARILIGSKEGTWVAERMRDACMTAVAAGTGELDLGGAIAGLHP
jgi:hypothetical protein